VLDELKHVFKEDAGLELNVSKTSILHTGVTQQVAFDVAQSIITVSSDLTHLSADLALPASDLKVSLVLVCLLERKFLYVILQLKHVEIYIIDDVEKLDSIQDGFIHYP
jgi:hypothetical protein